jgi:hydroxypyruvate isomerase
MQSLPFHLLPVVMKLSANLSLMYAQLPLPVAMQNAAEAGFQALEILFPYNDAPEQLARWLNTHKLQLVLINTPPGPGNEKGLAAVPGRQADFRIGLQQALNVCAATGCRSIHVMAGFVPPGSEQAAHDTLMENLQWAADKAGKTGCVLTLEPLNRADMPGYMYWQPDQVLAVLRAIDSDHVKLQFDFYHTQKESLSIEKTLQACAGFIHHVQFAGVNGRHEPDLQDPDVRAGLLALKAQGYCGWVGCEYRPASTVQAGLGWRQAYRTLLAG